MALTLIRDQHNRLCLTAFELEETPSLEWLQIQTIRPGKSRTWYRAFPLTGGAVLIQKGRFHIISNATLDHVNEALTGHGFNPAAAHIRSISAEILGALTSNVA